MTTATPQHAVDQDLTTTDVARILRCSADTVRRHHREWTATQGFPAARSQAGVRGPRWPAAAVNLWRLSRATGCPPGGGRQLPIAETDWHEVAAARGALLDQGLDPDAVDLHRATVPTLEIEPHDRGGEISHG